VDRRLRPGAVELSAPDLVETEEQAAAAGRRPLVVLETVRRFLDAHGLGSGPLTVARIGAGGGSNFSYLIERRGLRAVLRRPPRPPLPPSAHDVVREARLQLALERQGVRVPRVRAVCEDASLLGVPFYVADYVEGDVVSDELPPALADAAARRRTGEDLVDTLAEIHAVDAGAADLAAFARPGSYLERQVRRFSELWRLNATRDLPLVAEVGSRLGASMPEPWPEAVVHGDYRLGNVVVDGASARPVAAVLDWEMGAIGDPRADLGYLLATYAEPGGEPSPLRTSPVTATAGFPTRDELAQRYALASGRDPGGLAWFEALALFKAAVFCEAIYGRYRRGELTAGDARAAAFEQIVPELAAAAASRL
jgi:aminoglycoside phosphotransferase (APT) family kinase protein